MPRWRKVDRLKWLLRTAKRRAIGRPPCPGRAQAASFAGRCRASRNAAAKPGFDMSDKEPVFANLTDVFEKKDAQGSHVGARLLNAINETQRVLRPPFPRQIQVETSNICNHSCEFCAYTMMERPKRHMSRDLFRRLVTESYECGAREIGLFAGAEPLTCKWIDEYISYCRALGYEYIYISTNGALADPGKLKKVIDAGLSSIKFSVNGGDRETYRQVHGRDDFDKVIQNILFVSEYRKTLAAPLYLGVSFVGMPHTRHTLTNLRSVVAAHVDEVIYYEASNQSGQMPGLPDPPYRDCHLPFNKAHFSLEGYLKACCNDYENLLAVEDLNRMTMIEAWHSARFQDLRRRHLANDLEGTVCGNCIRASKCKPQPLNTNLVNHPILWNDRIVEIDRVAVALSQAE
jgi:wyosine [tRNA(Phe)-imidazoG37] synthetase (radical SAM superfamily)